MNFVLLLQHLLSSSVGSGQVRIIKPVNVHYFHYLFNASLNIVLEAILNEGDDVTNLDHDAYKYSNDMIKLY